MHVDVRRELTPLEIDLSYFVSNGNNNQGHDENVDKTAAGSRIAGRKRIVAGESETAAGNLGNLDSEVVVGSEIAGTAAVVEDFHCVMIVVGKCHSATNETSEGGIDHEFQVKTARQ